MKKLKAVGRVVLIVFAGLVLGGNIYLWNAQSLTGNALPMPVGYGAAVVLTGSMEPAIMTDDLILVSAREEYEVGDVVVYQSGSMLVVHRVVELDETTVTTQGDANQVPDAPVERAAVKGTVIGVIPRAGVLVRVLKTPAATLVLLVGAVLLMELSFRREKEKSSEELEQIKAEIRRLKDGGEPEEK